VIADVKVRNHFDGSLTRVIVGKVRNHFDGLCLVLYTDDEVVAKAGTGGAEALADHNHVARGGVNVQSLANADQAASGERELNVHSDVSGLSIHTNQVAFRVRLARG
jgi:hypothetical protein